MGRFGPTNRKIPVPKRHGVRDPLKRLAEKEAAIKDKINNPPKEHDVQEVSNAFKRFIQLKEKANHDPTYKRQRERPKISIGNTVVQKQAKETESSFLRRATTIQKEREAEVNFGVKYGVEVERDELTGAIHIRKRKGTEVDAMLKKRLRNAKAGKDGKKGAKVREEAKVKKLTLSEKKAKKKEKELEKKRREEDLLLREYQYDKVEFGEVVKGPPTLNTLPRRAGKPEGASRPGSKRLLLHAMIEPQTDETDEQQQTPSKKAKPAATTKIDLKGKRKNLPVATRMKIEREQQNVIEMYRQLKKNAQSKK
uniref:Putative m-type 9 protein n=1 Tax=Anopheles triannulatus TaxID=58253 RepID=A0A2M4ARB5_9DIPT